MGFDCSEKVVVAGGDLQTLLVGAQLAAAAGGPLLATTGDTETISDEIVRLNASIVYIVGDSLPRLPGGTEARSLSIEEALAETSLLLGGAPVLQASGPASLGRAVVGAVNGSAVVTGSFDVNVTVDAGWVASYAPTTDTVWLADGSGPISWPRFLAAAVNPKQPFS